MNSSWNFLGLSLAGGSLESFDELLVMDGPCNTDPVIVKRISGAGPAAAGAFLSVFQCLDGEDSEKRPTRHRMTI